MRRWSIILMLLGACGIATGGLDFVHQRQHRQQTEQWLAAARAAAIQHGRVPAKAPVTPRNDPNCAICQALHLSITSQFAQAAVPTLERAVPVIFARPVVVFAARIELPILLRGPPIA